MTTMGFVYLARGARGTFAALAQDIAALTRPGDRVLVVEDSGDRDTAARAAWWQADQAWGPGVTGRLIRTGTPAPGDLGVAVNLALAAFATPGPDTPPNRMTVWVAGSRIDRAAFAAARDRAESGGHDLVAYPLQEWHLGLNRVTDPPEAPGWPAQAGDTPASHAARLALDATRLIMAWPLVAQARAAEGRADGGLLALTWAVLGAAQHPLALDQPLGHGPHRADPSPATLAAIADLVGADLGRAALPWAWAALEPRLGALGPGPRGALMAGAAAALAPLGDAAPLAALRGALAQRPAAPATTGRARIRFHRAGAHAAQMPLAHPHLAPLWADAADDMADAAGADLILYAHPHDLRTMAAPVAAAARHRPLVLMSDNPLRGLRHSPDPLAWTVTLPAAHLGAARLHQVTHHRSPIFDFDRLPYAVLTRPDPAARLAAAFARNAGLTAADWAAQMGPLPAQDLPPPPVTAPAGQPGGDLWDLAAWQGWLPAALADTKATPAFERVHQPCHLTERLFDAFATGGQPLYLASPGHRVHDLGLPAGAWVNLHDQTAPTLGRDADFFAAYAQAQQVLARLWTDPAVMAAERARLGAALRAELARLADLGPA